MKSDRIDEEQSDTAVKPMNIGSALKTCFKIVKEANEKGFRHIEYQSPHNKHTINSISPFWLEKGTLNCVKTEPGLSTPLFLRFMLEFKALSSDAVLLVSKTPAKEVISRLAACISRIDYSRLKNKRVSKQDLPNLSRVASELYESDCYICCDSEEFSPYFLQSLLNSRSDQCEPFGLILISSPQLGEQSDNAIFTDLRNIAETYDLSIIVSKAAPPPVRIQNERNADDFEKIKSKFDLSMSLRFIEGFNFEIVVEHKSGFTGCICNLVINPANGLFEVL